MKDWPQATLWVSIPCSRYCDDDQTSNSGRATARLPAHRRVGGTSPIHLDVRVELTRIEHGAPRKVLISAWFAWWACAISWAIACIRLGAMFFSNLASGDGAQDPTGAYGTIFDAGYIAISSSTCVALLFVVLLATRTRRGGALAIAVILLVIGGVLFAYFREFAAWMVAAKGLFAFTPRMVRLDAIYTVLTLLTLFFATPTYLGQALFATVLVITAFFLAVSAKRWRAVTRLVEEDEGQRA